MSNHSEPLPSGAANRLAGGTILKIDGPPGSGKTRELAREVCRLSVEFALNPAQVLVLCVSGGQKAPLRAALKLEAGRAGLTQSDFTLETLDDWFLKCLREFSGDGEPTPHLLKEQDALVLLQVLVRQTILPGHFLYHASRQASFSRILYRLMRQLSQAGVSPVQVAQLALAQPDADSRLPLLADIYGKFQEKIHQAGLWGYVELARRSLESVAADPALVSKLAQRFPVIAIDEAQELSALQHRFLACLPVRLILAGNAAFGIRSFRGAEPALFQDLRRIYGDRPVTLHPLQAELRGNAPVLSLLNHFLPHPIWESQQPEVENLHEKVRFGFFEDPEAESAALAEILASWTQVENASEPRFQYEECAILLRSSRYRGFLLDALRRKNIPFNEEGVSEATLRLQHRVYDFLKILSGWQTLGFTSALLVGSAALTDHLAQFPLPVVEKLAKIQENNRHLWRWLEATLSVSFDNQERKNASWLEALGSGQEAPLLLTQLLNPLETPPFLQTKIQELKQFYRCLESKIPVGECLKGFPGVTPQEMAEFETFQENGKRLCRYHQAAFGASLPLSLWLENFSAFWENGVSANVGAAGGVRLLSLHQAQGLAFPCVMIPFGVSDEFPQRRESALWLTEKDVALLDGPFVERIDEQEEARLLAVGMTRATQTLILTSHRLEGKEPVLLSGFYRRLWDAKNALLAASSLQSCGCASWPVLPKSTCRGDFCRLPAALTLPTGSLASDSVLESLYMADSAWGKLEKQSPEPIFEDTEVLNLSASGIKSYMTCPRQFYYGHILRLKTLDEQMAANLGTLMHAVMEQFNRSFQPGNYTPERLIATAEALFCYETQPNVFVAAGYQDAQRTMLMQLSALNVQSLRQRLIASIEDLVRKGYFDRYATLKQVRAEASLNDVTLPGLERVRFRGKMDAVIQLANGNWEIVDYKTFGRAYVTSPFTCEIHFGRLLAPLPADEALSHAERFADRLNKSYPKDYQLLLYYLACMQDPAYEEQFEGVSLQVFRPRFPDNPEQGAIRLSLLAEDIQNAKDAILSDFQRYITEPLLNSQAFEPVPSDAACGYCGYRTLCERAETLETLEDAAS